MSEDTLPLSAPDVDLPEDRHPLYWLPNTLTVSRMIVIPVLVWAILSLTRPNATALLAAATLVLFLLCMATDYLDGHFARQWKVVSGFGRMLDPIADKLLVAGCLIAFCINAGGAWDYVVPAFAIVGRDILVSGAREHAALTGRIMPPTNLAKWKTAAEMLAILLIIGGALSFQLAGTGALLWTMGKTVLFIAAALSVYTGSLYFRAALKD